MAHSQGRLDGQSKAPTQAGSHGSSYVKAATVSCHHDAPGQCQRQEGGAGLQAAALPEHLPQGGLALCRGWAERLGAHVIAVLVPGLLMSCHMCGIRRSEQRGCKWRGLLLDRHIAQSFSIAVLALL